MTLATASRRHTCQNAGSWDPTSVAGEPSRAALLAAIKGTRTAIENKMETVTLEVNLLCMDLRQGLDKDGRLMVGVDMHGPD
ncbi:hypothetical protein NDU88_001562 [Pleurodeles waltl]|uniref:Uncharacterized protein n=1 Tax=Pleurodeles waltl TaxID=8319 RepID=A0AAV7RBM8_PLEWA|nr:hypothetical protein NDU88_001562 [Pleurodeles waltl]